MHEQDLINLRYAINKDISRLEHTRRQVAATLCGDRSLLEYKVVAATRCDDMSHWQIALRVSENFNENLCLHKWILSLQQVAQNQISLNLCDL